MGMEVLLLAYTNSITLMNCSYLPPNAHIHTTHPLPHVTGVLADISPTLGSTQAVVTEQVSNPQVGFDPTSVNATINDSKYGIDMSLKNFSDHSTVKYMFLSLSSCFSLLPPPSSLLPPPSSSLLLPPPSSPFNFSPSHSCSGHQCQPHSDSSRSVGGDPGLLDSWTPRLPTGCWLHHSINWDPDTGAQQ